MLSRLGLILPLCLLLVAGEARADVIFGTSGDDVLAGTSGDDALLGFAGNDTLSGGDGDDTLQGNDGNDILNGGIGADTLSGGLGEDDLNGGAGTDLLFGDADDDDLSGGGEDDGLLGGDGADLLEGGDGDDTMFGEAGSDTLTGDDGMDKLDGGDGDDTLAGGDGDDQLNGGPGEDLLDGGPGADTVFGGDDDDILIHRSDEGGPGELYDGGTGQDTLRLLLPPYWMQAALLFNEVKEIVNFVAANADPATASGGQYDSSVFEFSLRDFEAVEVNGVAQAAPVTPAVYVDPSAAQNGNGAQSAPFNHWSFVTFRDGQQYLQKAGEVNPDALSITAPGTAGRGVTISSYGVGPGGETQTTFAQPVVFDAASHVTIRDVIIAVADPPPPANPVCHDGPFAGNPCTSNFDCLPGLCTNTFSLDMGILIKNGSDHISVLDCNISGGGHGILFEEGAGGGHVIEGNVIHNNDLSGIYSSRVSGTISEPIVISNNKVVNNGSHGIGINASYFVIEDNEIAFNGFDPPGSSGIHLLALDAADPLCQWNIVRNNVIHDTFEILGPDGNGIEIDHWCKEIEVYSNLSFNNGGPGVLVFRSIGARVFENVFFNNFLSPAHLVFEPQPNIVVNTLSLRPEDQSERVWFFDNLVVVTQPGQYAVGIDAPSIFSTPFFQGNRYLHTIPGTNWFLWGWDVADLWSNFRVEGSDIALWNATKDNGTPDFYGGMEYQEGTGNLTGTGLIDILQGDETANQLDGAAGNDVLVGRGGADTLIGGPGDDDMVGGDGDDLYIVDSVNDVVREFLVGGIDTVQTELDYTMGLNVENLVFSGSTPAGGEGNYLRNTIVGNSGDNYIDAKGGDDYLLGGSGNDVLVGGEGNDILDGNDGADVLIGGPGNDLYFIDSAEDAVLEQPGEGTDQIRSAVSTVLPVGVENLTLTGTRNISGGGNPADNVLVGNSGTNSLEGDAGTDVLLGGDGDDALQGGPGDDVLVGGNGNDFLDPGPGADACDGGEGDDVYLIRQGEGGCLIYHMDGVYAIGGDLLRFQGFSPGATVQYSGSDGVWEIHFDVSGTPTVETFVILNATQLSPFDYDFQ